MLIEKKQFERTLVVSLNESRLTADISQEFSSAVVSYVNEDSDTLILDMGEVEFLDSSGLGSIMAIKKQTGSRSRLVLCSVNSPVMEILKLTRMNQVLEIYDDLNTAKAA